MGAGASPSLPAISCRDSLKCDAPAREPSYPIPRANVK